MQNYVGKANRQVADVTIEAMDGTQLLKIDTANTTTQEITREMVSAMAKGAERIRFANPLQGTMSVEAQIVPIEFYGLMAGLDPEGDGSYVDTTVEGVRKVSFKNRNTMPPVKVTMETQELDEEGNITDLKLTAHRASIDVNLTLSQSSEGDPASTTLAFTLLETADGDFFDIESIDLGVDTDF